MAIRGVTNQHIINLLTEIKGQIKNIEDLTDFISQESYQDAAHLSMKIIDEAQTLADELLTQAGRIPFMDLGE
jgi:uncharacterized protein with HEPN domain